MSRKANGHGVDRQIAALDLSKDMKPRADGRLVLARGQVKKADRAVKLSRAGRDLFELQHGRADRGGVDVGHHFQGPAEGSVLVGRPLAARRVLRREDTCQTTDCWLGGDAWQTWNSEG